MLRDFCKDDILPAKTVREMGREIPKEVVLRKRGGRQTISLPFNPKCISLI
jgi:hypothetical protein